MYTASSLKDHQKVARHNLVSGIERVPVYQNLFSQTGTFPSHGFRLKATKHQPTVSLEDVAAARHQTVNQSIQTIESSVVSGMERHRFFDRPLVPYMQAVPADVYEIILQYLNDDHMELIALL